MNPSSKTYYSISEVCTQTSLEPHVLRYWESEFSQLRPKKNRAGNRAYRTKDIDIIKYIKFLLYEEKFTIPGAKKRLTEAKSMDFAQLILELPSAAAPATLPPAAPLSLETTVSPKELKDELREVLRLLKP